MTSQQQQEQQEQQEQQLHRILELPDILAHIFGYLCPESLVVCLQVSQLFHTTIVPLIYSSITLGSLEICRPSLEAMRRYSHFVKNLSLDGFISSEYLCSGFNNLKSLTLRNDEELHQFRQGTDQEIMDALLKLIRENPRLTQWTVEDPHPTLSAEIWEAIQGTTSGNRARTAGRSNEEVSTRQQELTEKVAETTTTSLTAVVFVPEGGTDVHRVSFRIGKERPHMSRVRTRIEFFQITPTSISPESLEVVTSVFNNTEALSIVPPKLLIPCYTQIRDEGNPILPARVLPSVDSPMAYYLGLQNVYLSSAQEQLEFVSQFQQVRGLYWNLSKYNGKLAPPTMKDWQHWILPTKTWPHLRSLVLSCNRPITVSRFFPEEVKPVFPDDCVGHAVSCIPQPQLEQFWWLGSQIGALTIEALAGHFATLREIKLELTSSLEQSRYIQRIMESCPHLRVLRAGHLSVGDMRRGQPWVCLGLQSLSLRFDLQGDRTPEYNNNNTMEIEELAVPIERERIDYARSQHYMFSRLSELVLLEELVSIPLQAAGLDYYQTWHLDFQVRFGLDTLSSLKRLKRLEISFTRQQMRMGDVAWMVEHWKRLQTIEGSLTGNRKDNLILETFLNAHHIDLFRQ